MADEAPIAAPQAPPAPSNPEAATTVDFAANAIAALLARPGGTSDPAEEADETPAPPPVKAKPAPAAAAPDETPDETAAEAPEAGADEVADSTTPAPKQSAPDPEVERRLADADKAKAESITARDQLLSSLNLYVPQLAAAIQGEFADIKSNDDLYALADSRSPKYDPDRYNRFVIARQKLQDAASKQTELQSAKTTAWQQDEAVKLTKLMPELKDPKKGPVLAKQLNDWAKKAGYSEYQLSQASAVDIVNLHKAMSYDNYTAQKAADEAKQAKALETAQKKASGAPKVQAPGTQRDTDAKDERAQSDFARLRKTGDVKDATRVFQNILNS